MQQRFEPEIMLMVDKRESLYTAAEFYCDKICDIFPKCQRFEYWKKIIWCHESVVLQGEIMFLNCGGHWSHVSC